MFRPETKQKHIFVFNLWKKGISKFLGAIKTYVWIVFLCCSGSCFLTEVYSYIRYYEYFIYVFDSSASLKGDWNFYFSHFQATRLHI